MRKRYLLLLIACSILISGCTKSEPIDTGTKEEIISETNPIAQAPAEEPAQEPEVEKEPAQAEQETFNLSDIPAYNGSSFYTEVNGNKPFFTKKEKEQALTTWYDYSELDALGRAGAAFACINKSSLPKTERDDSDELSAIYPSGWKQVEYGAEYVQTGWLYNRSHLIGWALGGDTKEYNIVTATRYCNATSMLWFEEECLSFVKSYPQAFLLYRVTPMFVDNNLTCNGLLMEALSVEPDGEDTIYGKNLQFCVYVYNVQPGITITYEDGSSALIENYQGTYATSGVYDEIGQLLDGSDSEEKDTADTQNDQAYILNTSSKKIHSPDCLSVPDISTKNRKETTDTKEDLIADGYTPCQRCKP